MNSSIEYTTVKRAIINTGNMVFIENDTILEIRVISASRLIKGGLPMFAATIINHHIVILGDIDISPAFIIVERDNVFS